MDDEKLDLARMAGAQLTINSTREPLHDRLLEMTEGRGPDVAIEAIGTVATFRAAIEEVAFTGRVVYIGYAKERVCAKLGCSFKSNWILSAPEMLKPADFGAVIKLPEAQTFPVNQAVSRVVPLEQAVDALRS